MAWLPCALLLGGLLTVPADQDPDRPPQGVTKHVSLDRSFAVELPAGWRQITPDEAHELSQRPNGGFPRDLVSPRPPAFYPCGDAERWLARGFDGRCLTVAKISGEPTVDDAGVEIVRAAREADDGGPWRRSILDIRATTCGPSEHPAIECLTRMEPTSGEGATLRSLVLLVPTAGDTLILGFRAFDTDFDAALPMFRQAVATLTFARPPRGPSEIGDHLTYPLVVGALVGIMILVLRKRANS